MYYLWLVTSLILLSIELNEASDNKCGYSSCNPGKPGVLNVHLIAHSHDDVGWLKTVDQYYYGNRDYIQGAGVQYILDTVIHTLSENPDRKFSYVEMAYFTRWWSNQNDQIKTLVRQLVNEGRLQFLLGGWVMNDEADAHYTAIVDQMTLGLDFLNQTFGECGRPLVAWQIDPFGHSKEQSNLFALMGFDANIFMRLDYRDKSQRMKELRMELIQHTNRFKPSMNNTLFTSVLYDTYCPPATFCFDDKCQDPPMMDDPTLHDYNVNQRVNDFANYVIQQSKAYTTNHILVPMGCDFQFQNAYHNFVNLDKLIYHVNRLRKDINVIYSTPACYIYSVNNAKKSYSTKMDDFFPYASGPNSYWTGYFTSRSALKGFVRQSNNLYRACKQAQVISMLNNVDSNRKVRFMGMKMGVLQHHDAVTGTEKQEVAYDYAQRLYNGWTACESVLSSSLSKMIGQSSKERQFALCSLTNISYCLESDNMKYAPFTIVLYNSLTTNYSYWCRIPVNLVTGDGYYVTDSTGANIPSQLIPLTDRTRNIPERPTNATANYELLFNANIPSIGYSSYVIHRTKKASVEEHHLAEMSSINKIKTNNFNIKNKNIVLNYKDNVLASMENIKSQITVSMSQSLRYYYSQQGNGQSSGAYIFRPTTDKPISFNTSVSVVLITGNLVVEVHQTFSNWATLVTRLYKDSDKVESEWTVGPIPVTNPSIGREVVLHYETDLKTDSTFYTDSNSRQLVARVINKRFDYNFSQTEPVAGNYYPINSDVTLVDLTRSPRVGLIIHNDRAQGGGAYDNGMMELMLHRRILNDDGYGVGEALNELGSNGQGLIVRGYHWFKIGNIADTVLTRRMENIKLFNKPMVLFPKNSVKLNVSKSSMNDFSSLKAELPKEFHLTTLENHFNLNAENDYQILRIENLDEYGTGPSVIDLNKVFTVLTIVSMEELSLAANQYLKDVQRLQWTQNSNSDQKIVYKTNETIVSVWPGDIRTFKVIFKSK